MFIVVRAAPLSVITKVVVPTLNIVEAIVKLYFFYGVVEANDSSTNSNPFLPITTKDFFTVFGMT